MPPQQRGQVVALEALDLDVHEGEFFGLLGPNGAGKSTTIGILTTRVRSTSGAAHVAGADVVADPVAVRRRNGVVPQRPNPDRSLDAMENLVFHAAYFGVPRAEAMRRATELLERLAIADKAHAKVDELSGGQQQRLMIARALIHEPRVIFLDEPTVGLDPQAPNVLRAYSDRGGRVITPLIQAVEESGRAVRNIGLAPPSLETLFISLTGRKLD
jgi:ABC-2 type transport system ATP-binding protein